MRTLNRRIDAYLDKGHGEAFLRDPRLASIVEQALLYFDGQRYSLIERNPVEAGLCEKREDWVFSSAGRRVAVERAASAGR